MRVLFGMILGALLTVGFAYVHDHWSNTPTTTGSRAPVVEHQNMVNWDVVEENWRTVRQRARETWTTLSHKVSS
jgi:hypothetical protein